MAEHSQPGWYWDLCWSLAGADAWLWNMGGNQKVMEKTSHWQTDNQNPSISCQAAMPYVSLQRGLANGRSVKGNLASSQSVIAYDYNIWILILGLILAIIHSREDSFYLWCGSGYIQCHMFDPSSPMMLALQSSSMSMNLRTHFSMCSLKICSLSHWDAAGIGRVKYMPNLEIKISNN